MGKQKRRLTAATKTTIPSTQPIFLFLFSLIHSVMVLSLASSSSPSSPPLFSLQEAHTPSSPTDTLRNLADECDQRGIDRFDVYGDFHITSSESIERSFLRDLEATVAKDFGKADAVFMPSGVMAQSIALLIHSENYNRNHHHHQEDRHEPYHSSFPTTTPTRQTRQQCRFVCHETSRLLLHEQEGYRTLLAMDHPVVVHSPPDGCSYAPMGVQDVRCASKNDNAINNNTIPLSTLILEVPHRELGGKCPSYQDVLDLRALCNAHHMAFHCDGARLLEATAAYKDIELQSLTQHFDSIYISCYKGLGGLSGAFLLGSTKEFCEEARVWLRRFGGNLYTLLPYAVSALRGYDLYWKQAAASDSPTVNTAPTEQGAFFRDKRDKLKSLVRELQSDPAIAQCVTFDPAIPQVNMVHGYLKKTTAACKTALEKVERETGIRVLVRVREVATTEPAYEQGYRSKFEWTMGEGNGAIPDDVFVKGWKQLATYYQTISSSSS